MALSPEASDRAAPPTAAAGEIAVEFRSLYTAYFGFVWRCLRGLGVPQAGLDDAAQEVFVVVHRRLSEFRGESSLRTWLYGIVRNVASNQRRSERRRHEGLAQLAHAPDREPVDPAQLAQDKQAADFVLGFLERLDEKKREVFVLAQLEELSVPEVAETLGIPLNTAYTRLRAARLDLRDALARRKHG